MAEAIDRFVPDGATVALGTSLEPLIPFAAGHELIRQRRQDLELVGPISDSLFDELIGAGCVRRITAAWVGNVSEGLGHCYRRAAEQGIPRAIEIHDHTNFSISMALWAAAWNVPFLPARTLLGSDILRTNPNVREVDGLVHISAVRPDVTILHVQRCDAQGRAHAWGPLGVSEEAGLAAERRTDAHLELMDSAIADMAEKWEPNADGSVWTFHIRKDSKWSNGDPVTARDFEWSWKRQLNPETKAPYAAFLYDLKNGDGWIVTKELPGRPTPGPAVLTT